MTLMITTANRYPYRAGVNVTPAFIFLIVVLGLMSETYAQQESRPLVSAKTPANPLQEAGWGLFTHYLKVPKASTEAERVELWNKKVDRFDVEGLASQLQKVGAKYYFITIGQNSGFYCSPNKTYDSLVGRNPSRLTRRDLVAALYKALQKRGIKLGVYLPSGAPENDSVPSFSQEQPAIRPREKVYKTVNNVALKAYLYYPPHYQPGKTYPVIVFFFGGGWVSGNVSQFQQHSQYFARRGMIALTAEYRVASRHQTTPIQAIADAKSCVRWVRQQANVLGVDTSRIVVSGGSAGGHLAAATATLPGFDEPGEDTKVGTKSRALVLFNPVVNTTVSGYGAEKLGTQAVAASPVHHITKNMPSTLIFHGTADTVVPYSNIVQFQAKMQAAGNRCQVVPFENQGHGFFNYRAQNQEYYLQTIRLTDAFLVSLGLIDPMPAGHK